MPLHLQIAEHMRRCILQGHFPVGTHFQGSREIARELGCSRTVVLSAWDLLYAEGYLESTPRGGVSVAAVGPQQIKPLEARPPAEAGRHGGLANVSNRWKALLEAQYDVNWKSEFSTGAPDIASFPFKEWAIHLRQAWQNPKKADCLNLPAEGHPLLRAEIANFLGAVRGLSCTAEDVVVTSGTSGALDFCSRMILDHGDEVWVEEPGFVEARWALTAAGAKLVPVPVDEKGLCVAEGIRRAPKAKLIVVTPSHQYPLGVSMALERRLELLAWANKSGGWIIEDDYNSEFRHEASMTASLRSLDAEGRVIYLGTFSKLMMPSLRMGFMVAHRAFIEQFSRGRSRIDVHTSGIGQLALAEFMRKGHLLRHLRRMRKIYAARRRALIDAIERLMGEDLHVSSAVTGLHLVALFTDRLRQRMTDREAVLRMREAGIHVQPLSQNYLESPTRQGLVFGYGQLNANDAYPLIARMAECLRSEVRPVARMSAATSG
ncbi:PLP-dependent aminotransferase family protein [Bradyrhizobium sp. LHD-71]|nr:PLP-dependent aminotransferase family protein [Bradyrhizobium sp. LHD-71]MDQ8730740.1 PLP-dependent aminotransferase family protein [Bradyrhizobium sp. LHD-71]